MTMIAETISGMFYDDGQCFMTCLDADNERSLDEVCELMSGRREWCDGHGTDTYRWVFTDGSAITVSGDGWDLGFQSCFCWVGAGHSDECRGLA